VKSIEPNINVLVFVSGKKFYMHDDANSQVVIEGYGFDSHGDFFALAMQYAHYNSEYRDETLLSSVYNKIEVGKFYFATGSFKVNRLEDIQDYGDVMTLWGPDISAIDGPVEVGDSFYAEISEEEFRLFEGVAGEASFETITHKVYREQDDCIKIQKDQVIRLSNDDLTANGGHNAAIFKFLRANDGDIYSGSLDSITFKFVNGFGRSKFTLKRVKDFRMVIDVNFADDCQEYVVRAGLNFKIDDLVPVMSFFLGCCMGSYDGSFLTSGSRYQLFVGDACDHRELHKFIENNSAKGKVLTIGYVLKSDETGFDLMGSLNEAIEVAECGEYINVLWGMAHGVTGDNKCIALAG